jgi:hypothetical protein
MASSDFWHDRAAEFRALPGGNSFRGDWDYTANSGRPYQWRFAEGNKAIHTRFEALARRAASEMPNPGYSDLLLSWLEVLRMNAREPGITNTYTEQNSDGSEGPVHVVGSLRNLCEESAIYCDQLESDARQKEFEEKQRNDPRNWSQFRQQYEAFRSMKELISEPAEQIPEEFARNAIARIHNIKPEEVTPRQINFEIAGLLSSTKRSIKLIPSTARQESPPVAEEKHVYVGMETRREREKPEPVPPSIPSETIAAQLQRLRMECNWTIDKLAAKTGFDEKTVKRHLSGRVSPRLGNLTIYQQAFSKALKRDVVIEKMPPKRPP